MSLLSTREKKRIARIGKDNSNEVDKSSNDDDVVSEIIKAMDSSMKYSRKNVISYKQLQELKNRDQTTPSTSHGNPPIHQQKKSSAKQVKKFLPVKKHPLMEKCQKNLKHIKHNRSIPKQRAHVGSFQTSPKQLDIKSQSVNRLSKKEKQKDKVKIKNVSKKVSQQGNLSNNFCNAEKTVTLSSSGDLDKQTSDLINHSSSSESDFENFIRTQKEISKSDQSDNDFESSIKYKRKKKRRNDLKKNTNSRGLKKNHSNERLYKKQTKSKQFESTNTKEILKDCCSTELDDERSKSTFEVPLKRKFEESDESDDDMSNTYGCDATLSDSDYSETCRNSFSAGSLNVEKNENKAVQNFDLNLSLDLNKAECKQYISKNFTCSVRFERNAHLDKEILNNSLKSADDHEVPSIDENGGKCDTDLKEARISSPEEIILDSDDECTVICEIQKPNVLSTSESRPLNSAICNNSLSSIPQTVTLPEASYVTKTLTTDDSNFEHLTVISHSLPSLRTVSPQTSCDLPVAVTSFSTQTAPQEIAHVNFLQNSPQSSERDCLDVELPSETVIKHEDKVELTDPEFNVQILSVKSLGDSADYALSTYDLTNNKDDHRNSAELLDRNNASFYNTEHNISKCERLCENNKQTVEDDVNQRNINDSTNLTINAAILDKDLFKYAEFYSEPRNFNSNNDNLASAEEITNSSSCKLTKSEYQVSSAGEQNAGAIFIPKLDELLNKIDIETINRVIKQSACSDDSPINNNDIPSSGQNIIPVMSKEHSINIFETSDSITDDQSSFKPFKSDILETVNKIDFHQVLFLAKSGNITVPPSEENNTPESSVQNSLPFGEFLNETQQPPLMLGSTESEPLPSVSENQIGSEIFWQRLKDAVTVNSSSQKESNSNSETAGKEKVGIAVEQSTGGSHDEVDIQDATLDLPKVAKDTHLSKPACCSERFQQNISHLDKTSSSDMASYQTSNSLQKEIAVSSTTNILCRRAINNIHERKFSENEKELLLKTNVVKVEKRNESPSDELDVLATASIREFSESKPESILPLFNIYKKELQQYHKIISAEKNVSAGLKMLEETQAKKLKHIEMAIHNLVKNDPCFYKIVEETQFGKTTSSVRNCILPKEALKQEATVAGEMCEPSDPLLPHQKNLKCDNCAQAAKLKCLGCGKVYFCTVECGKNYWEKGHYLDCS